MQNSSNSGELSRPETNCFMSATEARGLTSSSKRIWRATSRARLRRDMEERGAWSTERGVGRVLLPAPHSSLPAT